MRSGVLSSKLTPNCFNPRRLLRWGRLKVGNHDQRFWSEHRPRAVAPITGHRHVSNGVECRHSCCDLRCEDLFRSLLAAWRRRLARVSLANARLDTYPWGTQRDATTHDDISNAIPHATKRAHADAISSVARRPIPQNATAYSRSLVAPVAVSRGSRRPIRSPHAAGAAWPPLHGP
jgi:hypothetical protein